MVALHTGATFKQPTRNPMATTTIPAASEVQSESRTNEAFPELTPEQLARIELHGRRRWLAQDEVVGEPGQPVTTIYVAVSGQLDVVTPLQTYTQREMVTDAERQELLDRFQLTADAVPVVIWRRKTVLKNPTIQKLADCLGLNPTVDRTQVWDVVIIGAGPAELGAAVYAASEGLNVVVVEANAPGGQAGTSSKIENYLGFPLGISGQELAGRAYDQA